MQGFILIWYLADNFSISLHKMDYHSPLCHSITIFPFFNILNVIFTSGMKKCGCHLVTSWCHALLSSWVRFPAYVRLHPQNLRIAFFFFLMTENFLFCLLQLSFWRFLLSKSQTFPVNHTGWSSLPRFEAKHLSSVVTLHTVHFILIHHKEHFMPVHIPVYGNLEHLYRILQYFYRIPIIMSTIYHASFKWAALITHLFVIQKEPVPSYHQFVLSALDTFGYAWFLFTHVIFERSCCGWESYHITYLSTCLFFFFSF